jgi:hypothetical protein
MFDGAKRNRTVHCVLVAEASDAGVSAMRDCRGCHEVVYLTPTRSALLIFAWLVVRTVTTLVKYSKIGAF